MSERLNGTTIITADIGAGISLLSALEMNIPIEDTDTAVRLSFNLLGYIFICKGILCFFVIWT